MLLISNICEEETKAFWLPFAGLVMEIPTDSITEV